MERPENNVTPKEPPQNSLYFTPDHLVAFYTLLTVLLKMKKELGLEAMLEYMAQYLTAIDSHNPKLAMAVSKTLEKIPIEVFYYELGKIFKNKI